MIRVAAICLGAALALCACAPPSTGDTAEAVRPVVPTELLAQVRAAGAVGNELDVQPLRDPQAEDLRDQASAAERRGDFATAETFVRSALALQPGDPSLRQWLAELALVQRRWDDAEAMARQSYETGPKLGGLCRRNWTTIQFARQARGDGASAASAQQRVAACAVPPPVRM
jgi:Flp pilus assembly protein TadD